MLPQHTKSSSSRRDSVSSAGSPFRQRRASLSMPQPPSPSMPLSAAASINASMRGGSPGPEATAKDSAAGRRSSIVAELALADDKLPPQAEIAVADRKTSLSDSQPKLASRVPSLSMQGGSSAQSPTGNLARGSTGASMAGSPVDPFKPSGLRDPFTGGLEEGQPQHHRTPSVSQVHQQMEQESEAQVNRLLITIHQQQSQIEKLQRQLETGSQTEPNAPPTSATFPAEDVLSAGRVISDPSSTLGLPASSTEYPPPPTPQRAHSSSSAGTTVASTMPAGKPSPTLSPLNPTGKGSALQMAMSHQSRGPPSSRGSSRAASPGPRSGARHGFLENDEAKYWQGEAQNLIKENEVLRQRVRELEGKTTEDKDGSSAMIVDG